MAISVQFNFDDEWAPRVAAMVNAYVPAPHDVTLAAILVAVDREWETLTAKQKWAALVIRNTIDDLMDFEGSAAAKAAADAVLDDIRTNFPVDIGPA